MIYAYEKQKATVKARRPRARGKDGICVMKKPKIKTGTVLTSLLVALLLVALLSGCAGQKSSREFFSMDTVMSLTVYGAHGETAAKAVEDEIYRLDAKLSAQSDAGEVARLNGGEACRDEETLSVLSCALTIAARTDGAYDPTVYPLIDLWGFGTERAHVPESAQIEAALLHVGYEKLPAVSAPYRLPDGMAVDFGGIGKGVAAESARQVLLENGVTSAVCSLGGNVMLVGKKPDGKDWTIGLQDPEGSGCFGYVKASDVSVVTSGGYQRYFEENGARYWHILNPETGYPAQTGLLSVTVVSRDDALADGLSTALFVMGLEKATAHWRASDDFEAVFLLEDGKILVTEGLEDAFESERAFTVIAR